MIKHYILAAIQWVAILIIRSSLILLGLFIVPIGILCKQEDKSVSDGRKIVNFPKWLWVFGNDYDGLQGDKHGNWADATPFNLPVDHFYSMWVWAAIRNPVNNMRRLKPFYCPANKCAFEYIGDKIVEDKPGLGGFRFTIATLGSMSWYGLYFVKEWSLTRACVIQLGFKIKPSHAGDPKAKEKGLTFEFAPYKFIG